MATTNIAADIQNITGVGTANAQFLISGQKFVASSIPKELLKWAATLTTPSSHGGNTSQGTSVVMPTATDSILDVSRNGLSATEVPYSMKGFIGNSSSLHLATATYPKYYLDNAVTDKGTVVIVKPDPTDSATARVLYVDSSKIDDDSDLRNAVVFHAASSEFSKLSSAEMPTVSIAAVPPDVPTLTSSSVSFGTSAPAYTKPSLTSRVSFNNYWTLGDFGDSDPGVLTISVSAPSIAISAPGVTTTAKGDISGDVPSYTPPSITNAADGSMGNDTDMDISEMSTASWTSLDYDFDNENMDFLKWFQVAGDFIQNEEDTELAAAQIQKINTYISAYQTAMQNKLNTFNKENVRYQANIQAEMQKQQHLASENTLEAQQTLEAAIQDASLEIQKYQAAVNDEVQEYSQKLARYQLELNTVFQAWQKTESDSLSQYQADMQNELNEFNKESAEYQAQLQVSIQNAQIDNEEDARKLTKYQSELQQYASEVQSEVSEFSTKLQKQQSYSKESEKYYTWAKLEIKNYIENNSKTMAATMAAAGAR